MSKFSFSPGLLGYGAKGADGSAGLSGLAIYFTDFNPLSDIIPVRSAIGNNEVLWSTSIPGTKLPGGRNYLADDLIIDPRGFIYKIISPSSGDYINTGMSLNKSVFFQGNSPLIVSDNGYIRYFNKAGSEKFIIDNIFSDVPGINYSLYPSSIYGIYPKNFARIEYSNANNGGLFNGFSVYSSGENIITDDRKSLAIVQKKSLPEFHIGNLDNNNFIRDVDLILDAFSLRYTRESGNRFRNNTPSGTLLTNAEKNTNVLFNNIFNSVPSSFIGTTAPSHVTLDWVLSDFANDPSITGILYFYKKENAFGSFTMDPSILRPLAFHNVGSSGSVIISGLTLGQTYEYFMNICKDGWERNSAIRQITTSNTPALFTILDPSPPTLTANANGIFTPSSLFRYPVTVSTDSFTGWKLTDIPNPDWISIFYSGTTIPIQGSNSPGVYVFDVSLSAYNGWFPRTGDITFTSEAPTTSISITQKKRPPITHTVKMVNYTQGQYTYDGNMVSGRIEITPPLEAEQSVTIYGHLSAKSAAKGQGFGVQANTQIELLQNNQLISSVFSSANSANDLIVCGTNSLDFTLAGVINTDILEVRPNIFDCNFWVLSDEWREGAAYIRLDSVVDADGYDFFEIDDNATYWNVERISCNCGTNCFYTSYVSNVATLKPNCS